MFIIKKLITPFILPPGLFVLLFLSAGIFLIFKKYRKTGSLVLTAGAIMWLLSIAPVADLLLAGLTRDLRPKSILPSGDVIVLLGGGVDDRLTDLSGQTGTLSEAMLARTVTAVRLYGRLKVPVIVSGGNPLGRKVSESEVARRYLQELGVPHDAIIEENTSRDTFENAKEVLQICKQYGFQAPILVSSDYHLKRALWTFQRIGLTCEPFANGLFSGQRHAYAWWHFLPRSFKDVSLYMHEYIGLLYYRIAY